MQIKTKYDDSHEYLGLCIWAIIVIKKNVRGLRKYAVSMCDFMNSDLLIYNF